MRISLSNSKFSQLNVDEQSLIKFLSPTQSQHTNLFLLAKEIHESMIKEPHIDEQCT